MKPVVLSDVDIAFPANVLHLMPPMSKIPENLPRKWIKFQQDWFYGGLKNAIIKPKPGVDLRTALRHLKAIQGSFEPSHEHKEAAVAYLASLWFEDDSTWECAERTPR